MYIIKNYILLFNVYNYRTFIIVILLNLCNNKLFNHNNYEPVMHRKCKLRRLE